VRFAVPAGLIAGTAALIIYFTALAAQGSNLTESRTAATMTLLGVGLAILVRLTGSLPIWRWALIAAMGVGVVLALTLPITQKFFDLEYPPAAVLQVMLVVVMLASVAVQFVPVAGDAAESGLPANTAA
jgi:cation-transporting ATPase E